jgi:hypothetical protein
MFFETLSSITEKEAPASATNQTRGRWYSGTARGTAWILFFGAMAGAAVGVLNLTAIAQQWNIENDFEILDLPITSSMDALQHRLDYPSWLSPIDMAARVLYWPLIGLSLTLLLRLIRDRSCRRSLLIGAGGGMLIGCVNLLAIVDPSCGLWPWFDFLDQPAQPLMDEVRERIDVLWLRHQTYLTEGLPYWRLTLLGYWLVIGLLLASLFCVVRMLVKRKAQIRRSEE